MTNLPQITLSTGTYKNCPVVFIDFKFEWKIVENIRAIKNANYLYNEKRWFVPKELFETRILLQQFNGKIEIIYNNIPPVEKEIGQSYLSALERMRYSENTIKTYFKYFTDF